MRQYCFARWRLSSGVIVCRRRRRLSGSVTLPTGGPAAGRMGGQAADTPHSTAGQYGYVR